MKKYVVLILSVVFCLVFITGCGSDSSAKNTAQDTSQTTSEESSTTASSSSTDTTTTAEAARQKRASQNIQGTLFVEQCNDVYLNPEDYDGKSVKIEGLMDIYPSEEDGTTTYGIFRYGPGCCGNDGVAGFQLQTTKELTFQSEEWIEVNGTFRVAENEGVITVVIETEDVTLKEEQGTEFVVQ
jgi:uncharacterized membrane protein YcgQ (UPF0703/DUF1980 family)